jgi:hypothetical protein
MFSSPPGYHALDDLTDDRAPFPVQQPPPRSSPFVVPLLLPPQPRSTRPPFRLLDRDGVHKQSTGRFQVTKTYGERGR